VPTPRWQLWAITGAITLGAGLGIVRLAQGGHFLSDIVASGFLVYGVSWLLHRATIAQDGFGALIAAWRKPSVELRRGVWLGLATALLCALAYFVIDRPVALFFHDFDPLIRRIFTIITQFGEGGLYLVPLGFVILWALWSQRRLIAWRAGFLFAAIAIPGLLADIVKPVFGRARPRLLFEDQLFGFTWTGAHADHWSFPSGHSITIVALATALYAIYPLLWPAYVAVAILVAASRVIIDAHYVSDVVAGAYFGFIAAWALAIAAKRNGVALAFRPDKLSDNP